MICQLYTSLLCCFACTAMHVAAQVPEYKMMNATVSDCKGKLFDSEANTSSPGNYAANEDLTFTICVPNASTITLSFLSFATENKHDTIRFFDGPDKNSPKIGGTYSGTNSPGTIVATSGCLTIHFKSDQIVTNEGWEANWTVDVPDPIPPVIDSITNNVCSTTFLLIHLNHNVPCDSIGTNSFTISGPYAPAITSAQPMNCVNDSTKMIRVNLSEEFVQNSSYVLTYLYRVLDQCDSLWIFTISKNFAISDCPIHVEIMSNDTTICAGECVLLTPIVTGGDTLTYVYQWSNGLPPTKGPHTICLTQTTTISLKVDDLGPSPADTGYLTINVLPKPDAGNDLTVCGNDIPFNLTGTPAGGSWSGKGIIDAQSGTVNPKLLDSGANTIIYLQGGCTDTVVLNLQPINAGLDEAACPNSTPFQLSGNSPIGGVWSGSPNVSPSGLYNPATVGIDSVIYTFNGCSDKKYVYVDIVSVQNDTAICQNDTLYYLTFSPPGGRWRGTGIRDSIKGIFNAGLAGPGVHTVSYFVNGCTAQQVQLTVKPISAGYDLLICPDNVPFNLSGTPAGGVWAGKGIADAATGLYNPGVMGSIDFIDSVTYSANGCTDLKIIYVIKTAVRDSLKLCFDADTLWLSYPVTQLKPWGGSWSGPGIIQNSYPGRFVAGLAGEGTHELVYTANNCSDTLRMVVFPEVVLPNDTSFCTDMPPYNLPAQPQGGSWSGTGITNMQLGTFDPSVSGEGDFQLTYTSTNGCANTMNVHVAKPTTVRLSDIDTLYCHVNNDIVLTGTPAGGLFSGPGVSGNNFNPYLAGEGLHTVSYSFFNGGCTIVDSIRVRVKPPIRATLTGNADSVCFKEPVTLTVKALGGLENSIYTYTWNNGLGEGTSKIVRPTETTRYVVTVGDGCSEPVSDTFVVYVHPDISLAFTTSNMVCYGESGFAKVNPADNDPYSYYWHTQPVYSGDSINTRADDYLLTITNLRTGCTKDTLVVIPHHPVLQAYFTSNPNAPCVSMSNPSYSFINLAKGATSGTWEFGDGSSEPFVFSENPFHLYADTGNYTVRLITINDAGCSDTFELEVCVEPRVEVVAPNSFSPNGDGVNDKFYVVPVGAEHFALRIFNRWGKMLYQTTDPDPDKGWDGNYNGDPVPVGTYIFLVTYQNFVTKEAESKVGTVVVVR